MKAQNLKTQYLKNPLGIETRCPRFTWTAQDGQRQSAYEIRTFRDGKKDWESGHVTTPSMYAVYGGSVESRDRIIWQIRLYDENDTAGEWSEEQFFEMGLLKPEDWQASWIAGQDTDREERLPADYYRKPFFVKNVAGTKKEENKTGSGQSSRIVAKARLYATACGVYEARLNGEKVGNGVLTPGCTEYEKHLYYQTYDVTDLLAVPAEGEVSKENVLDFVVGDGWYKGKLGCDGVEYLFGTQTKLLAQLEIEYVDGSVECIGTDASWQWSNDGPAGYNDLKDGICLDMTKQPSYQNKAAICTVPIDAQGEPMVPAVAEAPLITEHERFAPEVLTTPFGNCVLDFGQNMAGYVLCHIKGEKGQKIVIRMGETLDNGEFTQANFETLPDRGKSIDQKVEIVCDGEHVPDYPKFFYSGFRYALIEGVSNVTSKDFTAAAVYSDIEYKGSFICSNENINRFVKNTIWSEKSNFVDIPTDCPQREKGGWTGDAQVFQKTAMYLSEPAAFYRKWLKDVRDCQREDGRVDNVCPKVQRLGQADALNGSAGWADAAVIIPYQLWKLHGDVAFITENYELMHGWKEYVIGSAADKSIYQMAEDDPFRQMMAPFLMGDVPFKEYIVESGMHWGEWAEPEGVVELDSIMELIRPKQEENAAYMHYSMGLLAEMLETIGKAEEAAQCREYAEGAKQAYLANFVCQDDIESTRQAKLVRPLALGILEGTAAERVARRLNETAVQRDYKIGTGFLSTPFILPVLADHGYVETAYRMLENEEEPGWLAMVRQGATTVWEHYNGYDSEGHPLDTSYNHYSPGAVCGFLFEYTAGIRPAGERRFLLKPVPGGSLSCANAEWNSPYGRVRAGWKWEDTTSAADIQNGNEKSVRALVYEVEVPANCEAEIVLPDGRTEHVQGGTYRFK